MDTETDVVVLGLGPGGESVASTLSEAGMDVVGGECPYFGCIPTKMMVRASNMLAEARRIPGMAGASTTRTDWPVVARRIAEDGTTDWDDTTAVDRLTGAGVTFVRGHGVVTGPRTVDVGDQRFKARIGVVLNTGTDPAVPPIDGLADTPYWTNRDAVKLAELPESVAVIGGGPIGLEMVQVFARFGVKVTVIEMADRILTTEEPEASALIADALRDDGVRIFINARVSRVSYESGRFVLHIDDETLEADALLLAAGRTPHLRDAGLDAVGLDTTASAVPTDSRMRVPGTDGLWAIGDITGHGAFTHMSTYQAGVASADILGNDARADYRAVPHVTFTDPEIGAVGLTAQQAREQLAHVRVGSVPLAKTSRGFIHGPGNDGMVKVVENADAGVLVGGMTAGPAGGEMLAALTLAVHARIPSDTMRSMIGAFPTFHQAIGQAIAALE